MMFDVVFKWTAAVLAPLLLSSVACTRHPSVPACATVEGCIYFNSSDVIPGGFKVELCNDADASDIDIAFTGEDGSFVFRNVKEGFYYLTASKAGYSWVWTEVDGKEPIHRHSSDQRLSIGPGETIRVRMLFNGNEYLYGENLSTLDPDGNPVEKIDLRNGAGSVSFALFNGTGSDQYYQVYCRFHYVQRLDVYPVFTSMTPSEGILAPGESVLVTCYVDTGVYEASSVIYDDIHISTHLKEILLPVSVQ